MAGVFRTSNYIGAQDMAGQDGYQDRAGIRTSCLYCSGQVLRMNM